MDYKELLKKYIKHVGLAEGCDFIDRLEEFEDGFTEEEKKELKQLSDELDNEYDEWLKANCPDSYKI